MKTVTPKALCESYRFIYSNEIPDTPHDIADAEQTFGNWLKRYEAMPEKAIATQNWYGKVTTALFRALWIKQPRTKREMLRVLAD